MNGIKGQLCFFLCRGLLVKPHLLSREVGLLSRVVTLPEHISVLIRLVFGLWQKADAYRMVGGRGGVRIKSFLFMTKTDFLEFISEWRVGGIYYFLYMRRQKIKCFPSLVRVK